MSLTDHDWRFLWELFGRIETIQRILSPRRYFNDVDIQRIVEKFYPTTSRTCLTVPQPVLQKLMERGYAVFYHEPDIACPFIPNLQIHSCSVFGAMRKGFAWDIRDWDWDGTDEGMWAKVNEDGPKLINMMELHEYIDVIAEPEMKRSAIAAMQRLWITPGPHRPLEWLKYQISPLA